MNWIRDMEKLKTDKETLKNFGYTMGFAFLIITLLVIIKHSRSIGYTSLISGLFFLLSIIFPLSLKPLYLVWMRIASLLGWINTRIILIAMYYLIFTPISLVLRIMKKDLLDKNFNKRKGSYWIRKEKKVPGLLNYERQF